MRIRRIDEMEEKAAILFNAFIIIGKVVWESLEFLIYLITGTVMAVLFSYILFFVPFTSSEGRLILSAGIFLIFTVVIYFRLKLTPFIILATVNTAIVWVATEDAVLTAVVFILTRVAEDLRLKQNNRTIEAKIDEYFKKREKEFQERMVT